MDEAFVPPPYGRDDISELIDTRPADSTILTIRCCRLLGRGGFGSVYLAHVNHGRVAVKQLHSRLRDKESKLKSFEAESRLMKLSHPNIVGVFAATTGSPTQDATIIMEYVGDWNLLQMINRSERPLQVIDRVSYALDIARALNYLHVNDVIHLDVKPANIVLTEKNVCKLVDFGCSQTHVDREDSDGRTQRAAITGTYTYRAPELFRGLPATAKADVYALGVTMWQMLSMEMPFSGMARDRVIFGVVTSHLRPQLPSDTGELVCLSDPLEACYIDKYQQCWHRRVTARPSSADLVLQLGAWKEALGSTQPSLMTFSDCYQPDREVDNKYSQACLKRPPLRPARMVYKTELVV